MEEDIEIVRDVQVAQLQNPSERDDERDVVGVLSAHDTDLIIGIMEGLVFCYRS